VYVAITAYLLKHLFGETHIKASGLKSPYRLFFAPNAARGQDRGHTVVNGLLHMGKGSMSGIRTTKAMHKILS